MSEFTTSLLREKFTISDTDSLSAKPVIALSNRMAFTLHDKDGMHETFIVRSYNMHSCVRMSANILHSFTRNGSLSSMKPPYDWDSSWKKACEPSAHHDPSKHWVAVYNNGRVVYKDGETHPFLDIIEKFSHENSGDYESVISLAENAFAETGKNVGIDYEGNVALTIHFKEGHGRCGIILRGAERTATFSFSVTFEDGADFRYSSCLNVAGHFLEGIQTAYLLRAIESNIRNDLIDTNPDDIQKSDSLKKRLQNLNNDISHFEALYDPYYKPERPDFLKIAYTASEQAEKE